MPESAPRVLLTDPLHPDAMNLLERHARIDVAPPRDPGALLALARTAHGIIVRSKLPDDIVEHAPLLKGIVRHGVGLDFIPVEAATRQGVIVANLPGSNSRAVAEYCLAAMMTLRRNLNALDCRLRAEGWDAARPPGANMDELGGTTLGIVGFGQIGRLVAQMAQTGLGMTVLAHSRTAENVSGPARFAERDELFANSDVIVICCALTPETAGLVSAAYIAKMKQHAVLINVARAEIVDTPALMDALAKGLIQGAALDVFDPEPLPAGDPLLDSPNLLLTPHIAGITKQSGRAMSMGAVEEMIRILNGQEPLNPVNAPIGREPQSC